MTTQPLDFDRNGSPVAVRVPLPAEETISTITFCTLCNGPCETVASGLFDTRFGIEGRFAVRRCRQCGGEQIFPLPTARSTEASVRNASTILAENMERFIPGCGNGSSRPRCIEFGFGSTKISPSTPAGAAGGCSTSAAMKEGLYATMPATVSRRKERS